jgi:hypothetical protein
VKKTLQPKTIWKEDQTTMINIRHNQRVDKHWFIKWDEFLQSSNTAFSTF